MVVSRGLAGGIRRAQFPTQLYLFASWGVGASDGHQTDIFITSRHKYTNTNANINTNTNTKYKYKYKYKYKHKYRHKHCLSLLQVSIEQIII